MVPNSQKTVKIYKAKEDISQIVKAAVADSNLRGSPEDGGSQPEPE